MIYTSEKLTPVRAIGSHCGTGACMNILNYFWGTTFALKDTFDIETMIRFGHFDWSERPGESEIGYFLAQMNFRIEIYTQAVGDWDPYLDDPVTHQQKHGYTPHSMVDMDRAHMISQKLRHHPNVSLYEDPTYDITSIIRAHSDGKHMFLFGLDGYIIHNTKKPETEKDSGHIMASVGYISPESDKIGLIETAPAAEVIQRTYEEILAAQADWCPNYDGPSE